MVTEPKAEVVVSTLELFFCASVVDENTINTCLELMNIGID